MKGNPGRKGMRPLPFSYVQYARNLVLFITLLGFSFYPASSVQGRDYQLLHDPEILYSYGNRTASLEGWELFTPEARINGNYDWRLSRESRSYRQVPLLSDVFGYGLKKMYLAAVKDTANPRPREIWKDLTAITEYNNELIWQGTPGESPVLVTVWTDFGGYIPGEKTTLPDTLYLFVTVTPQLQNFCKTLSFLPKKWLTLRLEQLLGLPPQQEFEVNPLIYFVELYVNLEDLVRPSRDPEIVDQEASLAFSQSKTAPIDETYKMWFINRINTIYTDDVPYPFTQLGYTYDWGKPKYGNLINKNVGLSEFVILPGSEVEVLSVSTIETYCDCR